MRAQIIQSLLFGCIVLTAAPVAAYTFDEQCAPVSEHAPGFDSPNVMLVVDRSGSMKEEMASGWTRWRTATTVIKEVTGDLETPGACTTATDTTCDPVRFGLGFFSSVGSLVSEPAEDNATPIRIALDDTNPSGQTQTHTGANIFAASAQLKDATRPQVGVLITDGTPDDANTARFAVRQLCNLRTRPSAPVTTYMVGFGSGSNRAVNGFMAAAGGTGVCCQGADFPCSEAYQVDPCDLTPRELNSAVRDTGTDDSTYIQADYQCGGSIEATDGEAFKRALLSITEEASCSFDLAIPSDYPDSAAFDDPSATWVEMVHRLFGDVRLPYCAPGDTDCGLDNSLQALGVTAATAAEYSDEGWYFPDATRRRVRVTDGLCSEIQGRAIEQVRTQVACVCRHTGEDCTVTLDGFTNEQLQNMRCAAGTFECVNGQDVCVSNFGPMPEICNGVDDDCDGSTDNMRESWDKSEFQSSRYDIPEEFAGIECRGLDVCMCPNGADEVSGTDPASFFSSWSGGCLCGEGLDAGDPSYTPAPVSELDEPQAACSALGSGAGGSLFLILFGALVLGVRRHF